MSPLAHDAGMLRELGLNLGLLGALVLGHAVLDLCRLSPRAAALRPPARGLLFGLAAVLVQLAPLPVTDTLSFDARPVVLGVAGAYLPALPAALAAAVAIGFRLAMGGGVGGVAVALAAVLLGAWWQRRRERWGGPRWRWLASLGGAIAIAVLALQLLWSAQGLERALRLGGPLLALHVLGTVALGWMLDLLARYREGVEALQQALAERGLSEQRLATTLEASGAALWEWWPAEHRVVFSGGRHLKGLGFDPASLANTAAMQAAIHPDDLPGIGLATQAAFTSADGAYQSEFRMRNAQGQWHWLLSRGRVVERAGDGTARRLVGTMIDVDTLRRQQAALLAARERFQKIYQTTPDAMGITRIRDDVCVDVNDGMVRMTGHAREAIVGQTTLSLNLWADPAQRRRVVEAFARDGQVDSAEVELRHRDGRLVRGLMSVRRLAEQGEDHMLFIVRDITEHLHLRNEAAAARAEVATTAAASRAKTDFLSRMSHELRTPLNAVLGFAQLLQTSPRLAAAEREQRQAGAILQSGWHLLRLIDDVLDISRIEAGHLTLNPEPTDPAEVLRESVALLQAQAGLAGVTIAEAGWDALPPRLLCDPVRLRQTLANLLSNAVKYNRPGGRVTLRCEADPSRLLLHVEDNGRGMTPQQMAHLFEPFNRLGREREGIEGTGIGLVLTRHLVELMGGSLTLRSETGQGTTATLALPLRLPQAPPPAAPPATFDANPWHPAPQRGRVLYVEDSLVNQEVVRNMLDGWPGVELRIADDAAHGWAEAQAWRPELILLDLRLPDAHGATLIRRLKADPALAAVPVVALSANAMPDDVAQAMQAGAVAYWTKPLQMGQFLSDLRRLLDGAAGRGLSGN